jgi:hypothetical protein
MLGRPARCHSRNAAEQRHIQANGLFPNVFNNETPDGSFGVTSPIFIDQLSTGGGLIGTIPVTGLVSTQLSLDVATSFPSKSELGLSLTPGGTGVTFMAYGAASNLLDISNSNTPGHVDITNPVNGKGVCWAAGHYRIERRWQCAGHGDERLLR